MFLAAMRHTLEAGGSASSCSTRSEERTSARLRAENQDESRGDDGLDSSDRWWEDLVLLPEPVRDSLQNLSTIQ